MNARRPGRPRSARGPSIRRLPGVAASGLLLVLAACASNQPQPEADRHAKVAYWEAFPLTLGGSAVFPDGIVVTFEDVPQDSRCPRGVQCAHAGSATVLLTVWTASGEVDSLSLEAGPASPARGLVRDRDIELRRLLPEPVADVETPNSGYTAVLVVGKY